MVKELLLGEGKAAAADQHMLCAIDFHPVLRREEKQHEIVEKHKKDRQLQQKGDVGQPDHRQAQQNEAQHRESDNTPRVKGEHGREAPQQQTAQLDLLDQQKTLYSTIQDYWLNAQTNQQKYKAASATVESEKQSYDLLQEQFRLGLKNIVELMTGKDNLLSAQQNQLQSKYQTIYNQQMLHFYETGNILK
jgi:hypothetical protein